MRKNTGKSSEQIFEDRYASHGKRAFVHRITDSAEVRGRTGSKTAWVRAQPSDYLVTFDGKMEYAEVKSSLNKTSFPFGDITKIQMASAKKQRAAGGHYFFYLHSLVHNKWFRVPASVLLDAEARSLKWANLGEYEWI
jgi:penicillin-binding protein-related factor A (putative recombinase)